MMGLDGFRRVLWLRFLLSIEAERSQWYHVFDGFSQSEVTADDEVQEGFEFVRKLNLVPACLTSLATYILQRGAPSKRTTKFVPYHRTESDIEITTSDLTALCI